MTQEGTRRNPELFDPLHFAIWTDRKRLIMARQRFDVQNGGVFGIRQGFRLRSATDVNALKRWTVSVEGVPVALNDDGELYFQLGGRFGVTSKEAHGCAQIF